MKLILSLILQLSLILLSCQSNDPTPDPIPPENLTLKVDVATDGSGKVTATATATNSEYYEFHFGDNGTTNFIMDGDGTLDYVYAESGTYEITVRAFAAPNIYSSTAETITIKVTLLGTIPKTGYTTPESYDGYNLVWQDEFNGTDLNLDDWTHEIGNGTNGWGNNELEYYKKENTIVQDGYLAITAKKESFGGKSYTSSRIITKDKQAFKYGRVDIRAALPKGQGIWPALWMLGSNISSAGWPACGEIDIMEMIGGTGQDNTIHGTAHWDHEGSYASYGNAHTLTTGIYADEFHVFSIVWDESTITWYMDDIQYNVIDITPTALDEFQKEFFFIFNVAVGGNWPGSPDGTTKFPQRMVVDYIRMFQVQ